MSCNPAIGGLGKGHLVREIDALDGVMGRAADRAGIQFRMLNRSKGPAVRGPRTQIDRKLYRQAVQDILAEYANPDHHRGRGRRPDRRGRSERPGRRRDWPVRQSWRAGAVVVTTGTFLKGVIHIGEKRIPAGRVGEAPAIGLSDRLYGLGLKMGRLKTGTPARLDGTTIDWSGLEMQAADDEPIPFSFLTDKITTPADRLRDHLDQSRGPPGHRRESRRSAVYSGRHRRARSALLPVDRGQGGALRRQDRHQIFLEPEGLDDDTVYPNGISTSLPEDARKPSSAPSPASSRW